MKKNHKNQKNPNNPKNPNNFLNLYIFLLSKFSIKNLVWCFQKQKHHFPFFLISWFNTFRYCVLLIFSVSLTTRRCVLPLAVSELFISWMCHRVLPSSTYLTQVYDDTNWWISRYQTLGRELLPTISIYLHNSKIYP